ncbi:MAG: carbohydrate binding domain-containing protein [Candidatus Theseobacter exili]|nr:carbohydrate binding domain-containing protein [Candidatus Theseobacter exili]
MMNKNCFKILVGVVLGLFLLGSPIYASENLIKNGGFEQGKEYFNFPKKGVEVVLEKPHSGKRCLRIQEGGFGRKGFVEIKPDTTYTCSFWYRTDKTSLSSSEQSFTPKQTFQFQTVIYNSVGRKIIENWRTFFYPSTQWRQVKTYFYSRDNTKVFIHFSPCIPSGNLHIDDLTFFPTTDDEFKDNLIVNGEFEEEFPYHWSASRAWRPKGIPVPPVPAYFLDKESGFQMGKQSLRMDCKEKDGFSLKSQYFPVRNEEIYTYSLWMKSDVKGFPVRVMFYTLPKKGRKHFHKVLKIELGLNWEKYDFEVNIPDINHGYYEKACIQLSAPHSYSGNWDPQTPAGSLWIDKVEVYEVEE